MKGGEGGERVVDSFAAWIILIRREQIGSS